MTASFQPHPLLLPAVVAAAARFPCLPVTTANCLDVALSGQDGEHSGPIDPDGQVTLSWDADQPIDVSALENVLDQPKTAAWSGAIVGPNEPFDGVWLRLTATEPGTCRIAAESAAIESGRCTPAIASRSPAIVDGSALAYFALRRLDDNGDQRRWELGAIGHGPAGQVLADRLCDQIRAWDSDRIVQPAVTAYPMNTPADRFPGEPNIDKRCIRIVVSLTDHVE